jgi:collagen type VII alpha
VEVRSRVEASSVGGSALPATGSGGLVGVSGPIALTGPVSVTGVTGSTALVVKFPTGSDGVLIATTGASGLTGYAMTIDSWARGIQITTSYTPLKINAPTNPLGAANVYALEVTGNSVSGSSAIRATAGGSNRGVDAVATSGSGVVGTATTGIGVYAIASGTNGVALRGEATGAGVGASVSSTAGTNYALTVTGDTTSPAWAPMRLVPVDTNPTNCAIGDLAVVVNVLKICTASNTWTTVGVQTP